MRTCPAVARRAKEDDVLRDAFKPVGIVAPQRHAVVHAKAAVFPTQELAGQLRGEQLLLDKHPDDPDTEELLQGRGAHPRRDVEHAVVREEPVGWRADLPGLGFPTFPGYGIELWAGGNKLAADYDAAHSGTGAATPAGDEWKDAVVTYTSPSSVTPGQVPEIRLIGYGIQTNYDNVRLGATLVADVTTGTVIYGR